MGRSFFGAGDVVAAILVIAGVAVAAVARERAGWAAVAAGVIIGAVLLAAVLRGHVRQIAALTYLQVSGTAGGMRMAAEQRLADARIQVAALGLPADPDMLRELADADDQARVAAGQWDAWEASRSEAESDLQIALGRLYRELSARGAHVTRDAEDDFRRYVDDCARRREQAADAAWRPGLESQLRDRRQAEKQAADGATRLLAAEQETALSRQRLPVA